MVGVGPSCAADAQVGYPAGKIWLVRHLGYHHLRRAGPGGRGRGAAPPWWTTAATRENSACWLTSPTTKQSSRSSIRARSAQPRETRARRPCPRTALMATGARSFGARMLPKPTYTGGVPASRNPTKSAGSGRSSGRIHAGLHDLEVRRFLPGGQGRVRRQPRVVGEDEVADVVHRWQADRRPLGVERRAVQRVVVVDVQVIQHPAVGHVRWDRPARQRERPVVRRRQEDRAVAHVHGADAQLLRHGPCAGGGRHQATRHQRITSLGRGGELVELLGDQLGYEPGHVRRRRRCRPVQQQAHRLADRHQRTPPTSASRSEQSGGALTRTSAPSARNCTASATSGSTSPRPPYVDNNTRISQLPSSCLGSGLGWGLCATTRVLPQAPRCGICREWQGVCAKVPIRDRCEAPEDRRADHEG